MLCQISIFLIVGTILPMVVVIALNNKLGGILYYLLQIILPYIMFSRLFPKYGLEKGHPPKVVYSRIIVASIIWSLAIYLERYSYIVFAPVHRWLVLHGIYVWQIEMFIYWSFSLTVTVLISGAIASLLAIKK